MNLYTTEENYVEPCQGLLTGPLSWQVLISIIFVYFGNKLQWVFHSLINELTI